MAGDLLAPADAAKLTATIEAALAKWAPMGFMPEDELETALQEISMLPDQAVRTRLTDAAECLRIQVDAAPGAIEAGFSGVVPSDGPSTPPQNKAAVAPTPSKSAETKRLPNTTSAALAGGRRQSKGSWAELSEQDVVRLAGVLDRAKKTGGADDPTLVAAVLNATAAAAGAGHTPAMRAAAVSWLNEKRTAQDDEDRKFSDGLANARAADTPEAVVKVKFYDNEYRPDVEVEGLCDDVGTWYTPTGLLWPHPVIRDLKLDGELVLARHAGGQPPEVVRPLWLYSVSQLGRGVVWAVWVAEAEGRGRWRALNSEVVEEAFNGTSVYLSPAWFDRYQFPAGSVPQKADMGPAVDPFPAGLRTAETTDLRLFYAAAPSCPVPARRHFFLCRYECLARGDVQWSPLRDTVAWLPPPSVETKGWGVPPGRLPPPGVLEYLYSRGGDEALTWPRDEHGWEAAPCLGEAARLLVQRCFQEPDQQAYHPRLHDVYEQFVRVFADGAKVTAEVRAAVAWVVETTTAAASTAPLDALLAELDALAGAVPRAVFAAKCGAESRDRPPPGAIAHSLELQRLDWGGETCIVGLSGTHAVACASPGTEHCAVTALHRCNDVFDDQVFWHLGYAMRSKQFGTATSVAVSGGVAAAGVYEPVKTLPSQVLAWDDAWDGADRSDASHPEERLSSVVFTRADGAALRYDGQAWVFEEGAGAAPVALAASLVKLTLGAWLLPQALAFIYYLDAALAAAGGVPGCGAGAGVKTYRGLKNCVLPRSVYDIGKIAVWSAYSSTSADRGVASQFAQGNNAKAAVFSITGDQCVCISRWSRFGREREWLYPPNSAFLVQELLDEEQARIMGLDNFQLFTVKAVGEVEALIVYLQALVSQIVATVPGSTMPVYVEQVYSAMQELRRNRLTAALRLCCGLDAPMVRTTEGRQVAHALIKMGADRAAFTDIAMHAPGAAPAELTRLVQCGAAFEAALGWMAAFEERGRGAVEEEGLLIGAEVAARGAMVTEALQYYHKAAPEYRAGADAAFTNVQSVRVSNCGGAQLHMNGVYNAAPPRRVPSPYQGEPFPTDLDEYGWTLDAGRPWGCFVAKVRVGSKASAWGVQPGQRIAALTLGAAAFPVTLRTLPALIDDVNARFAAAAGGAACGLLQDTAAPVFAQANPTRFQSHCTLKLQENGEWRVQDADIATAEAAQRPGWDAWLPVGRAMGLYDRTANPFRWLLGAWAQKPEHKWAWALDRRAAALPQGCVGGVHAKAEGNIIHEGIVAAAPAPAPAGGVVPAPFTLHYNDALAMDGARTALLAKVSEDAWPHERTVPLGTAVFEAVPGMKAAGVAYHATLADEAGAALYVDDLTRCLRYRVTRTERVGRYPHVTAVRPVVEEIRALEVSQPRLALPPGNEVAEAAEEGDADPIARPTPAWVGALDGNAVPFPPPSAPLPDRAGRLVCGRGEAAAEGALWAARNKADSGAGAWHVVHSAGSMRPGGSQTVVRNVQRNYTRSNAGYSDLFTTRDGAEDVTAPWCPALAALLAPAKQQEETAKMRAHTARARAAHDLRRLAEYEAALEAAGAGGGGGHDYRGLYQDADDTQRKLALAKAEAEFATWFSEKAEKVSYAQLLAYRAEAAKKKAAYSEPLGKKKVAAPAPVRGGMLTGLRPSLFSIHIGQAGIRLGGRCWELYQKEHGVEAGWAAAGGGDADVGDCSYLFSEETNRGRRRLAPNALFVDYDMDGLFTSSTARLNGAGSIFNAENFLIANQHTTPCFDIIEARRAFEEAAHNMLDVLMERVDALDGVHLTYSPGGGAGASIAKVLCEVLEDRYRTTPQQRLCITSVRHALPVQLYNTSFALADHVQGTAPRSATIFCNETVQKICSRQLKVRDTSIDHANCVMAEAINSLTLSSRFPNGSTRLTPLDIQRALLPYNRGLRFNHCAGAPYVPAGKDAKPKDSAAFGALFTPAAQMIGARGPEEKTYGQVASLRGVGVSYVNAFLAASVHGRHADLDPWCSGARCLPRLGLCPTPPVFAANPPMQAPVPCKAFRLANSSILEEWLEAHVEEVGGLKKHSRGAYRHWFKQRGMCEGDFDEALEALRGELAAYREARREEQVEEEEDEEDGY